MRAALVLSGGGAGGAFQVGVLKRLWPMIDKEVDAVYGTSVGALNGAALRHIGIDELEKLWLGIKGRSDVLTFNPLALIGFAKGKYKTHKLKEIITKVLANYPKHFDLAVKVSVVDLSNGEVEYSAHHETRFSDMVLASASVPFHMEPVGNYVDGGVRDHTPIQKAIDDGFKKIYVICCNPWSRAQHDTYKFKWPYLVDIGLRSTDILQAEILHGDLGASAQGVEVIRYSPKKRIIDTFEYNPEKIRLAIAQGMETKAEGAVNAVSKELS